MKEKILSFSLFFVALCLLPYSHKLLTNHQVTEPEAGVVAGVSSESPQNWCTADSDRYFIDQKREALAQYERLRSSYQQISDQNPPEAEAMSRLIADEYSVYTVRVSELDSQKEESDSVSCLPE